MMKRLCAAILALTILATFTACGREDQHGIVGVWSITDPEQADQHGSGLEFTRDGSLRFGWTRGAVSRLIGHELSESAAKVYIRGLDEHLTLDYTVLNESELRVDLVTSSVIAGSDIIPYTLAEDRLIFNGIEYTRSK